jgi:uncharacterized protein (TIGR00369 family)
MSAVELFPGHSAPMGLGVIPLDELASRPGLELLQRVIDGLYPAPHMAERLSFGLMEVASGKAVFHGLPSEAHLNPLGAIHGGWAAAILDSALGCAVHTVLDKGEAYTTAEFKVNFIRPITPRTGVVVCEGRVLHRGKTLALSEASLKDANGKLLAFGTETCAIFPAANLISR